MSPYLLLLEQRELGRLEPSELSDLVLAHERELDEIVLVEHIAHSGHIRLKDGNGFGVGCRLGRNLAEDTRVRNISDDAAEKNEMQDSPSEYCQTRYVRHTLHVSALCTKHRAT